MHPCPYLLHQRYVQKLPVRRWGFAPSQQPDGSTRRRVPVAWSHGVAACHSNRIGSHRPYSMYKATPLAQWLGRQTHAPGGPQAWLDRSSQTNGYIALPLDPLKHRRQLDLSRVTTPLKDFKSSSDNWKGIWSYQARVHSVNMAFQMRISIQPTNNQSGNHENLCKWHLISVLQSTWSDSLPFFGCHRCY